MSLPPEPADKYPLGFYSPEQYELLKWYNAELELHLRGCAKTKVEPSWNDLKIINDEFQRRLFKIIEKELAPNGTN